MCFSQQRGVTGRNSQQRREPGGGPRSNDRGGGGRGQGKVIVIPLSTGRETKLKTTENAWKPSAKEITTTDEDEQTAEVCNKREKNKNPALAMEFCQFSI